MAASTSSFFLFLAFLLGLALGADSAAGTVAGLGAVGGCMGASELNIWLMLADAGAGGCATAVTKGVVAAAGVRLLVFNKQGHQLELNLLVYIALRLHCLVNSLGFAQ